MNRINRSLETGKRIRSNPCHYTSQGFNIPGILPENIEYYDDSRIGIRLWDQWLAMLRDIRQLDRVLVSCRNSHAIIGEFRFFPELISDTEELSASDLRQAFRFNFTQWHQALAWSESRPCGRMLKIEAINAQGMPFFRVSLTANSDRENFWTLVQTHQGWATHWQPTQQSKNSHWTRPCLLPTRAILNEHLSMSRFWDILDEIRFTRALIEVQVISPGATQTVKFSLVES